MTEAVAPTLEGDVVCSSCLRLVNTTTGKVVVGWEHVKFIDAPTDHLCDACKEPIIENLAKAIPLS